MRIRQLGESCLIIKELPHPPAELAHTLNAAPPPGLLEAVPAFDQLALYFDPDKTDQNALQEHIADLSLPAERREVDESTNLTGEASVQNNPSPGKGRGWGGVEKNQSGTGEASGLVNPSPGKGRGRGGVDGERLSLPWGASKRGQSDSKPHTIPALYSGPDLAEAAQALNLTPENLIRIHAQAIYTVEAIGFCPGFPYLSGLPAELQNLPRKASPRTKVEPGTIGITGDQCCIYPLERPGGWNLIARTPLTLVDPENACFPLKVGDSLTFRPIGQNEFNQMVGAKL